MKGQVHLGQDQHSVGMQYSGQHNEEVSDRALSRTRSSIAQELASSSDAPSHARREYLDAHPEHEEVLPTTDQISKRRYENAKAVRDKEVGSSPAELTQLVEELVHTPETRV